VPRRTRAARAALRSLRRRHNHLAPMYAPAYASYGAAGAAMGIAIFGPASLWAIDPGFAAEAGVAREMTASGTMGSGWTGGGSSCGSSSGGGSSCGSSSGGGSSCGGGGGGGGCGG